MNLQTLREKLENHKTRSYWAAGVKEYAAEIIDHLEEKEKFDDLNAGEYNYTGSMQNHLDALNGAREDWLDVQARALFQAESLLNDLATGRK